MAVSFSIRSGRKRRVGLIVIGLPGTPTQAISLSDALTSGKVPVEMSDQANARALCSGNQGNHAAEAEIQKICSIELRSV
jgi:hypothetical protein